MPKIDKKTGFFLTFYIILIIITLRQYLVVDASFIIGLAVLPFCFQDFEKNPTELNQRPNTSFRHAIWLIPTTILAVWTHSFTLFYLACVSAVLLLWESRIRKLTVIPLVLFVLISPIFRYFTDVFTFDIRLKLTEIAVFFLQKIDPSVSALGNAVKRSDGSEWQIDEACMGLNMLGISLILTVFFMAYFSKRQKKPILLRGVFSFLVIAICLNIFCNLLRIIALVHFRIQPHTFGHDAVGLLALAIYVIVPMFFIIKKLSPVWSRQSDFFVLKKPKMAVMEQFNNLILLILLSKSLFLMAQKTDSSTTPPPNLSIYGFDKTVLPNGIAQFTNDSLLIYVKPLKSFYTTEHSPMICWRGSGFDFQKIEKVKVGEGEIYTGLLAKGDSTLHTAWWFEDESGKRTVDQTTWRWAALTEGVHFRLVNVNAGDEAILREFIHINKSLSKAALKGQ